MSLGRVILIEPNPGYLLVARNILTRAGFAVEAHASCALAAQSPSAGADVVIADLGQVAALDTLPGEAARSRPVIFTRERARPVSLESIEAVGSGVGPASVVEKPFVASRLLRAVEQAMAGRLAFDPKVLFVEDDEEPRLDLPLDGEGETSDLFAFSDAPRAPTLAAAGSLELLPIDQVLQLCLHVPQPARLRIEERGAVIEIFFVGSRVVFARHLNMPEGFMLGRMLAAEGVVSSADLDRSLGRVRTAQRAWLGQHLVAEGLIKEPELQRGLTRQAEELVYEAVRWCRGRFELHAQEPLPREAEMARVSLPVQHLLLEGMRRLDEWQRISSGVGNLAALVDRRPGVDNQRLEGLGPEEREIWKTLDGQRTVAELVERARRPTFDVCRALDHLRQNDLVTVFSVDSLASSN